MISVEVSNRTNEMMIEIRGVKTALVSSKFSCCCDVNARNSTVVSVGEEKGKQHKAHDK
jgi:hypothetical protein